MTAWSRVGPQLDRVPDWRGLLAEGMTEADLGRLRRHGRTGRPCGAPGWIAQLEEQTGRKLKKSKPGPKPQSAKPAS